MMNTVTGDFKSVQTAEKAITALRNARFADQDIGIVAHDRGTGDTLARDTGRIFMTGMPPADEVTSSTEIFADLPPGFVATIRHSTLPADAVDWYKSQLDSGDILLIVNPHDRLDDASRIITENGGMLYSDVGTPPSGRTATGSTMMSSAATGTMPTTSTADVGPEAMKQSEVHVPLIDEEIILERTPHQVGEVEVASETTTQAVDVPAMVTHEEIRVERRTLDHPVHPNDYQSSAEGGVIRMPIVEEELTVTKTPVVREELVITKMPVQETQTLHESVMHTEPMLETTGSMEHLQAPDNVDMEGEDTKKRPAA